MKKILKISASLVALAIVFNSCDGDKETPMPVQKNGIQLDENPTHGKILTDANGRTLYYFSDDVDGKSACTGGCLTNWPIYHSADVTTDAKVNKAEIGEITRADGMKQSTYKGWPLYYFKEDTKAKEIKGDKVGDVWYVAKPDYTVMVGNKQLVGADNKTYIQTGEGTGKTLYLTDDRGRTLYAFINDKENKNSFTKENDAMHNADWPIYGTENTILPSYVNKDLTSKIAVFGKPQLTYKGWPLYYYKGDEKRGDTKGVSQPSFGVWPIVNATSANAPK